MREGEECRGTEALSVAAPPRGVPAWCPRGKLLLAGWTAGSVRAAPPGPLSHPYHHANENLGLSLPCTKHTYTHTTFTHTHTQKDT